MTTTTAVTYGAEFSQQHQTDGIYGYINGGGYTPDQTVILADALFDAFRDEVSVLLPEGASWQPATSEFLVLCNSDGGLLVDLPDHDGMTELFGQAWAAVEARYEEIETSALAA